MFGGGNPLEVGFELMDPLCGIDRYRFVLLLGAKRVRRHPVEMGINAVCPVCNVESCFNIAKHRTPRQFEDR